jgi:hypothetical protein
VKIIITQWSLDSYLKLVKERAFSKNEYWNNIRPDVLLLSNYPDEPKFNNNKFWSVAEDASGNIISCGFKMKWHQIGNGKVQLRLPVVLNQEAFLCEAYVKRNAKFEKRKLAIFKTHAQLILQNRYKKCGVLI